MVRGGSGAAEGPSSPELREGTATSLRRRRMRGAGGRKLTGDRRSELLQQLEELFLRAGFAHLTIDALTEELHCSKSTLYAIAPSRDELVIVVIKHFFRTAAGRIESQVAAIDHPRDRIASYLAGVGREMSRVSARSYADMVTHEITRSIYDHNSRVAAARVHSMIQEGIESGAFRQLHAEFVGEAISLLIEGIQEGALLQRTGLSSGEAYRELSSLVLGSLANNGEPADASKGRS